MDSLTGIFFGIIAMISWGTADFFAATALKDRSSNKILYFWTQSFGLLPMLVLALFFFSLPDFPLSTAGLLLLSGLLTLFEYLFLYKAMQVGVVSLVSPLCATYPVITVVLSVLFLNEMPDMRQTAAIFLMVAGTILAALDLSELRKAKISVATKGLRYAAISATSSGALFAVLGYLVKEIGWFIPFLFMKFLVVSYLFAYFKFAKEKLAFPEKKLFRIISIIAILEVVAFLSYGLGAEVMINSLVVPISSTYPLVTIVLAAIFMKEKIAPAQYLGIASIIFGIALISLP